MAKQELTTTKEKGQVALTGGLALQERLISELEQANKEIETEFTPYGKTCIVNCIAGLVSFCKGNGININDFEPTLLRLQLQNVGFVELNYASNPSELYFDARKITTAEGKESYSLTIKPQGAGNEKLVRKYGVGLVKNTGLMSAWLVREGDDFSFPSFNGIEMTPPKWTPKGYDKKVIMVVYPAKKIDGTVEYLIATRESVKANLVAQIRQNTLYAFKKSYTGKNGKEYETVDKDKRDKFYAELDSKVEKMTIDEMLADPELLKYINPTYTSGGSKEAMILRKMKNNALKNYPKEYDNSYIHDAVENMFEEQDTSVLERKNIDPEQVEATLKEVDTGDKIEDFDVEDTPEETTEKVEKKEGGSTAEVQEQAPQTTDPVDDDVPF